MLRLLSSLSAFSVPVKGLESSLAICISCRTKRRPYDQNYIRSIPEEWKSTTQLDNLNLNDLRPQYRHIKALEDAAEDVRKIFTLRFATHKEKLEAKYLEYAEKLQRHEHDNDSLEMKVAALTIKIRDLQEEAANMLYENKKIKLERQSMITERNEYLLELRSKNYEKYCLTVKVLDLNVIFWPEYDLRLNKRMSNIIDMKLRTFAELKRKEEDHERKAQEVARLQSEILEQLKSGELSVPSDESN